MNELVEFLKTDEVRIVFAIAIIICIFGTLYFILEKSYQNRKKKRNTKELNNLVEQLEVNEKEESIVQTPVIEQIIDSPKDGIEQNETIIGPVGETIKDEKQEEPPLVIPLEEFQKKNTTVVIPKDEVVTNSEVSIADSQQNQDSVTTIYEKVKDEIESLELEESRDSVLQYTDVAPNKEEAKEELRKVTAELIKAQTEGESQNIELTEFEEEQEKNAIISVDELMKKSEVLYEQNEVTQYEDEGNEPISLQDLERRMNDIKKEAIALETESEEAILEENVEPVVKSTTVEPIQKIVMDDFYTVDQSKAYQEDHVFKSSPIISPIFGIEKQPAQENNLELENTANYEKLDEEIKKTNEFLATLRELQKNLD